MLSSLFWHPCFLPDPLFLVQSSPASRCLSDLASWQHLASGLSEMRTPTVERCRLLPSEDVKNEASSQDIMYTTKWTIDIFIRHDAAIINACECAHELPPQDSQFTCYSVVVFHILVGPSERPTSVQCKKILEAFPRYIAPFADMPSPTRPSFVAFPRPSFQPVEGD